MLEKRKVTGSTPVLTTTMTPGSVGPAVGRAANALAAVNMAACPDRRGLPSQGVPAVAQHDTTRHGRGSTLTAAWRRPAG
jgi:hypothetical protein